MTSRTRKRHLRSAAAAAGLLLLVSAVGVHAAEPSGLEPGRTDPRVASGSEVLALGPDERAGLERWVRRGGQLALTGDAGAAALEALASAGACGEGSGARSGLGELILSADGEPDPAGLPRPVPADLTAPASRLAGRIAGTGQGSRVAVVARLAGYAALLLAGLALTAGATARRRMLGGLSLVLVFGLWPVWARPTPWAADRRAQVDAVLDTGCGPVLLWGAATLEAGARATHRFDAGPAAWDLRLAPGQDGVAAESSGTFELARGERREITWLADVPPEPRPPLALLPRRSGDDLHVMLRNGLDRAWRDAWILVAGREAVRLDPLEAGAAKLVELPAPARSGTPDRPLDAPAATLARDEARLLRAAGPVIGRWLGEGRVVLVAWTDAPVGPATDTRGGPIGAGATLWISARPAS